jgi:hypothetical protein
VADGIIATTTARQKALFDDRPVADIFPSKTIQILKTTAPRYAADSTPDQEGFR